MKIDSSLNVRLKAKKCILQVVTRMIFCPSGKAGELIDRGDNTYGGKYVINPSGGLISKGHPLGATGEQQSDIQ